MINGRDIAGAIFGNVLAIVGVAIAVATLAFIAAQLAPGGAAYRIAEARYGERVNFASVDEAREIAGLDQPIIVQYGRWVGSVLTGQLGHSIVSGRPVTAEVWRGFQTTSGIAVSGVIIALTVSLLMGFAAGFNRDGYIDKAFLVVSVFLSSIPPFLIGLILVTIFAIMLQWLPAAGVNLPGYSILPAGTLALILLPDLSRVARNAVIQTMQNFYPVYGRIKGQSWLRVIFVHALRPTLVPIIAYFAPMMAHTVAGMVVIDVLFNLDGLGTLLIDSVLSADIPMAMGAGLIIGVFVVVVNGISDVVVLLLDPRLAVRRHL